MKKTCSFALAALLSAASMPAAAQQAVELKQQDLSRWNIGTADYSGIAPMGGSRYAVVSDKGPTDGFFVMRIEQDSLTGEVCDVRLEGFHGNPSPRRNEQGQSVRDCEGVAYVPSSGTVFISGEGDQQILEYAADGRPTGRCLAVPPAFALPNIVPNYGFEALTYCPATRRFWTTTESTLPADGPAAGPGQPGAQNLLRLQAFDEELRPVAQYAYRMDRGKQDDFGVIYALGVSGMTALPDGRLVVMEREADVSNGYLSSTATVKLFLVNPAEGWQIDSSTNLAGLDGNKFLVKQLIAVFATKFTPFNRSFANYEGICLGRQLADGRQTLLLIADSQSGYGRGVFHLKDYVKVLILPDEL